MKFEIVRIDYQKFCYHGNVTWGLLLSILPNEHDSVKLRDCRKRQKAMPRWPQIPIKIFSTYPPALSSIWKLSPRTFFHRNEVLTNKCPAKEKMGQEKWKIKGGGKAKGKSRLAILRHFWTQKPISNVASAHARTSEGDILHQEQKQKAAKCTTCKSEYDLTSFKTRFSAKISVPNGLTVNALWYYSSVGT